MSRLLEEKDFLLINVHIPYEGEIAQTDFFIPFNAIEEYASQLPADKSAKIVVYCRSGSMSATAAETLVQLGYSNILNLDGGMIAWEEQGYPLLQNPR
ncbi:MAG: rhodanese-like domain-containing protein [Anaerolineae bacterium]